MTNTSDASYALADWGTTSFRLWLVTKEGKVLDSHKSRHGMSSLTPNEYEPLLERILLDMGAATGIPVLICGMAGAAQGWLPVPYLDLPTRLEELHSFATTVPGISRDVRILPGLAQRQAGCEDVMRGEETLLLGAMDDVSQQQTICLPGTHSKWVNIDAGEVTHFQTAMTGEVFAILSRHSTLSHFLKQSSQNQAETQAFALAVREGFENPGRLLGSLFSLRARPLLNQDVCVEELPARLSGLLIGMEIAGILGHKHDSPIMLLSSGALAQNYAQAFELIDQTYVSLDADQMALRGLLKTAQKIWP